MCRFPLDRSILLFPEGRRSDDGSLNEFKTGGIALAIELGMDIVPVTLCGCRMVMGRYDGRLISSFFEAIG